MQSDTPLPPAARSPDRGIFISHGHADAELAESLARLLQYFLGLRPDQITCSSTPELGLRRGGDVNDEIKHRIERSSVFVLLATANSAASQWVPLECGLASAAAERGTLKFFVAVPTPADREAVPAPYAQQVSVTLSQERDTWQFLLQLRGELGEGAGNVPSFVESLLDLEQKCSAIEASRAAKAGLAREAEYKERLSRAARWRWAACAAMLLAVVALGVQYQRHAGEAKEHAAALIEKDKTLSAQALACEQRRSAELAEFSFSGFIHDPVRGLKCARVSVRRPGPDGTPKDIPAICGADGVFVIPGADLKADPRERLPLTLFVGGDRYETVVDRSSAPIAIKLAGGGQ
jgi:hypothetical protein